MGCVKTSCCNIRPICKFSFICITYSICRIFNNLKVILFCKVIDIIPICYISNQECVETLFNGPMHILRFSINCRKARYLYWSPVPPWRSMPWISTIVSGYLTWSMILRKTSLYAGNWPLRVTPWYRIFISFSASYCLWASLDFLQERQWYLRLRRYTS